MADTVKLDIGCGTAKTPGYVGVDRIGFPGVDVVLDISKDRWPWDDNSVDEAKADHIVEHLTPPERIHFANEMWRVLKVGGKCQVVTPHFGSNRAYGDLTHQWPPVVAMWYYYLNREWRKVNAPHNDEYVCNFDNTAIYQIEQRFNTRPLEFQQFAVTHYLEGAQDLVATLIKLA